MGNKEDKRKARQDRLREWFLSNPPEWEDLVAEFKDYQERTFERMADLHCYNRDFMAGKCRAYSDMMNIDGDLNG